MTCREFITFLMQYLDDELPPGQRSEFNRHLELCPSCVAYLRTYVQTVSLGKAAYGEADPLPDDVPEDLVRAILSARQRS